MFREPLTQTSDPFEADIHALYIAQRVFSYKCGATEKEHV
jgi:hypothetical protein